MGIRHIIEKYLRRRASRQQEGICKRHKLNFREEQSSSAPCITFMDAICGLYLNQYCYEAYRCVFQTH